MEVGLPSFLQHDIDEYVKDEQSSLWDCLWGEPYGSINAALCGGSITEEQAVYLRGKYMFDTEADAVDWSRGSPRDVRSTAPLRCGTF